VASPIAAPLRPGLVQAGVPCSALGETTVFLDEAIEPHFVPNPKAITARNKRVILIGGITPGPNMRRYSRSPTRLMRTRRGLHALMPTCAALMLPLGLATIGPYARLGHDRHVCQLALAIPHAAIIQRQGSTLNC
jgi:hypothetical protein